MISNVLVIDTNLIFSALVSQNSSIRDILFEGKLTFYAPNYLIIEIHNHYNKLLKFTQLTDAQFRLYFNSIFEIITFIPTDYISLKSREKAYNLCKDVDLKDIPFLSLSIELNVPFWTGDKKLKKELLKKGFENLFEK